MVSCINDGFSFDNKLFVRVNAAIGATLDCKIADYSAEISIVYSKISKTDKPFTVYNISTDLSSFSIFTDNIGWGSKFSTSSEVLIENDVLPTKGKIISYASKHSELTVYKDIIIFNYVIYDENSVKGG